MTGLIFHLVGNVIIPIDELIFFRGVETTNEYSLKIVKLLVKWLGGSELRSVWGTHIPYIFTMNNGEPVGAT